MQMMKDSGKEWLGYIPVDWDIEKFKYHLSRHEINNKPNEVVLSLYRELGVIPKDSRDDNHNVTSENTTKYKYVQSGNFVVNKMKAWQGSVAVSNFTGIISPAYYVYRFTNPNICKKYFHYLLRGCYKDEFMRLSGGVRIGQWDLPAEKLENTFIIIPSSYDVQEQIANFLDEKCEQIDSLTTDIQSQIKILEEYKKSVIIEAVTKGLDPDVELKDSGVEWIGMIPDHWDVEKIKYHLKRNELKNPGNMQVLSVYREYGVIPKDSRDDNHNVTSDDTSKYKYVRPGDLVINKMKAWQGSLAVSDYEGIVSPAYFIYNFENNRFDKKYFHFLIRSCYKDEFRRISGGIREGQWDLPADGFANEFVLIPPIEDQQKIANYLEIKCSYIETIISEKKEQLETLSEYKKSVIYEYVTGKKEVVTA